MKSIILCGFMGCGKSTVGQCVATLLGMPFIDLDSYIVDKAAMSIKEIFAAHGEQHFRALESAAIRELAAAGAVLATGGGALINPKNAEAARAGGMVIFLDLDFDACYERIQGDGTRPLVMSNTREQLHELFDKRREIYLAHSEITINAAASPEALAQEIAALYKNA